MAKTENKNDQATETVQATAETVQATAETVQQNATAVPADDRVDITIPRGAGNDDPNLLVAVNGVNYLLPRGKTSKVPEFVAKEIRRSWSAQEKMDQKIDQMLEAAQAQTK